MLLASAFALWIIQPLGALVWIFAGERDGVRWGRQWAGLNSSFLLDLRAFTLKLIFPTCILLVNTGPVHNDT